MIKTTAFTLALSICLLFATLGYAEDCIGDDCPGYDDGYKWGQARGYENPDDCGGRTEAFIEGCQAAAERQRDVEMQRAAEERQAHQEEQAAGEEEQMHQQQEQADDEDADSEDKEDGESED